MRDDVLLSAKRQIVKQSGAAVAVKSGVAVHLDDANNPRMLIVMPRTDAARREADALGLSIGTIVEQNESCLSLLMPFDERKAAAANGSDTGIVAMLSGVVRVQNSSPQNQDQRADPAPMERGNETFKNPEPLTDEERSARSKSYKKTE